MVIDMQEPVALTFALRYLNSFAKATPLASQVMDPHTVMLLSDGSPSHRGPLQAHTLRDKALNFSVMSLMPESVCACLPGE